MRALRWIGLLLSLLVAFGLGTLVAVYRTRPSLDEFRDLMEVSSPAAEPGVEELRVTFLGVSTLALHDGRTTVLTDGFFSRPGLLPTLFGEIGPDAERIDQGLRLGRLESVAAVIPVHSHYDHAMDAPEVARRTGAVLLGSESTANIGRGQRLPEEQIRVARSGEPHRFGDFVVTLIASRHVEIPGNASTLGGTVDAPLVPPARALAYAEGVTWSVHLAHPLGNVLVQGSAGFVPGALDGYPADVVLLGVGGLGALGDDAVDRYLAEVVDRVGATRVYPVHYDDFTVPLDHPMELLPTVLDDFPAVVERLRAWSGRQPGRRVRLLPVAAPVRLFRAEPPPVAPDAATPVPGTGADDEA